MVTHITDTIRFRHAKKYLDVKVLVYQSTKTTTKKYAAAYLLANAKIKPQKQIWKSTMHIYSMSHQGN